jgi:hypothetical protein
MIAVPAIRPRGKLCCGIDLARRKADVVPSSYAEHGHQSDAERHQADGAPATGAEDGAWTARERSRRPWRRGR